MIPFEGKYAKSALIMADGPVDNETQSQITRLVNHPAFTEDIRFMPDYHAGKGAVIGFTMPLPASGFVVPNVVGVDVGCGMFFFQWVDSEAASVSLRENREEIDTLIREFVPTNTDVHTNPMRVFDMKHLFPWKEVTESNRQFCLAYNKRYGFDMKPTEYTMEWFQHKCSQIGMDFKRAVLSVGTLGGGNHFIELSDKGVIIHSGSRQFGKCVAEYWQKTPAMNQRKKAELEFGERLSSIKALTKTAKYKHLRHEIPNMIKKWKDDLGLNKKSTQEKELDYLEGEDAQGYLTDMIFAQAYASWNRRYMVSLMLRGECLGQFFEKLYPVPNIIETVHNYIDFRDFIIRKGAVRSYEGEPLILPFNMEDGTLICEGRSNREWNFSAPHGAGRLLSRRQAKENIKDTEAVKQRMREKGVYASIVPADEAKEAYKDPAMIEEAIQPTAKVIDRCKPIITIKGE